jgi:hypothetical protein
VTPGPAGAMYAIKTKIQDSAAKVLRFVNQKTMYRGIKIAAGDAIYLFSSENDNGHGLIAKGIVLSTKLTPKKPAIERQTPRVSIVVRRTALARQALGRSELKRYSNWSDGRPQTELNFKFYRQATNKIVGISQAAAHFLDSHFEV